ncbi:MAG: hypothetical protein OES13_08170 [Acidimicrobiia bacterium]|nr:hypothetical protein [Acidimicrobiia bacterium]
MSADRDTIGAAVYRQPPLWTFGAPYDCDGGPGTDTHTGGCELTNTP